ncbi:MAG TPA: hypothetical protein VJM48_15825, partial [Methylibium sp.]|nr:hypothetical protein [Methylibium sp.]
MSLSSIAPLSSSSAVDRARAAGPHQAAARPDRQAAQEAAGPQAGPRPLRSALTDTLAATAATGG